MRSPWLTWICIRDTSYVTWSSQSSAVELQTTKKKSSLNGNWISHYQLDWTECIAYNVNLDSKEGLKHRHFYYFRCYEANDVSTKELADVGQWNMGNLYLSGFTSGNQAGYPSISQMTPGNCISVRTEPLHIGKMKSNLYAQILFMYILCFFHFFHVYGHKGNLCFQLAEGDCWFLGVNWLRTVTTHTLLSSLLCHINSKLILSQKTQNQMDFGKLYLRHINFKYLSHFSVGKKQHNHSSLPSSPNSFTVVTTTMKETRNFDKIFVLGISGNQSKHVSLYVWKSVN